MGGASEIRGRQEMGPGDQALGDAEDEFAGRGEGACGGVL